MVTRHAMGKEGMLLAILVSVAMIVTAFYAATPEPLAGRMGLCLPSPNEWPLTPFAGWLINLLLMGGVTVTLYLLNKEFNFVRGSDTVLTGTFLVMASSNAWITEGLSSSLIMALANLICLLILFGCYRKKNSTQEIFVIATILSIGSMIQYAFIFMMPAYLLGAMLLKCFNFKSFIAFLMGIAAPYWIAVGLGIIPLDRFRMPTFTNMFDGFATTTDLFFGMANIAFTVLLGLMIGLNNSVRLYAGNTQRRLYNMVLNVIGLFAVGFMLIDFTNMVVYMATIYMITAVQLANMFSLRNVQYGGRWLLCLGAVYVASLVLTLFW